MSKFRCELKGDTRVVRTIEAEHEDEAGMKFCDVLVEKFGEGQWPTKREVVIVRDVRTKEAWRHQVYPITGPTLTGDQRREALDEIDRRGGHRKVSDKDVDQIAKTFAGVA